MQPREGPHSGKCSLFFAERNTGTAQRGEHGLHQQGRDQHRNAAVDERGYQLADHDSAQRVRRNRGHIGLINEGLEHIQGDIGQRTQQTGEIIAAEAAVALFAPGDLGADPRPWRTC